MFGKKKNLPARQSAEQSGELVHAADGKRVTPFVGPILDKAQRLQQPAVKRYVAHLRQRHPQDTPAQIIARLEKQFLTTVTASGGAVGATAAVPGVGTVAAIGAMTAETALFIEASALLALAIAEVHGISPEQADRRKALVLAVALGDEGTAILGKAIGARGKKSAVSQLSIPGLPGVNLTAVNKALTNRFVRKFTLGKAPVMFGKVLPGGIGAVIGGVGNRAMGNAVIRNAREAFGTPPAAFAVDGSVVGTVEGAIEGSATRRAPAIEDAN